MSGFETKNNAVELYRIKSELEIIYDDYTRIHGKDLTAEKINEAINEIHAFAAGAMEVYDQND